MVYHRDSAAAGASAAYAAEVRALEAEIEAMQGRETLTILWDFAKLFDTISPAILLKVADAVGFPIKALAASLLVHHAPRRLKLGQAIGEPVVQLGWSILAGCKRSTDLARVSTLRIVRSLARHTMVNLHQHVDDLSNLVKSSAHSGVVANAFNYTQAFIEHVERLRLQLSGKSVVIPASASVAKLVKLVESQLGFKLKCENAGVDIGVDTCFATRRVVKKQKQRVKHTAKKSGRAGFMAKRKKKARQLGLTNIKPAQDYGYTSLGAAPTVVHACKTNISKATGMSKEGACATTIIKWSYRHGRFKSSGSADPRAIMPVGQIKAWIRLWSQADRPTRNEINTVWSKAHRRLKNPKTDGCRSEGR